MPFEKIDLLFATYWCQKLGLTDKETHSFLSCLFYISRKGHFCLDPDSLPNELSKDKAQIVKGAYNFFNNEAAKQSQLITKWHDAYYLQRQLRLEKELMRNLFALKISHKIAKFKIKAQSFLSEKQNEAIKFCQKNSPIFITGGPGSGKTFVAKSLIQEFLCDNPESLVTITALTAKAGFLFESIKNDQIEIKTLHSLVKPNSKKRPMIHTDLLIIDECSMISPYLFNLLLKSLFKNTIIVFMGDAHQLAPVESLCVFEHLATNLKGHHFHLASSYRSNSSIQTLSNALLAQNETLFFNTLLNEPPLKFIDINTIELVPFLTEALKKAYPKNTCTTNTNELLILTAFRNSSKGYIKLNQELKKRLNFSFTPITIEKNDPSLQLCNGQMAILSEDWAHFHLDGQTKKIHRSLLPVFSPSFATSIHKSQGSSAEHCIIILDKTGEFFSLNLLYTAITRAKKRITLISTNEILKSIMLHTSKLSNRLSSHVYG